MNKIKTFEAFNNIDKKSYIGQCNTLRRMSDENEQKWHDMMKDKKEISFTKFIKNVDGNNFLDDGENMKTYIKVSTLEDDSTKTYISHWGDAECMFLQTCGFEFIFI